MHNKKKIFLEKYNGYVFAFMGFAYLMYRFTITKVYYEFMVACIIGIIWGLLSSFCIKKFKNMSTFVKFLLSPFFGILLMTQFLPPSGISIFFMTSLVVFFIMDTKA